MRKVIGAINMTLDGIFDHTSLNPDGEVHDHYSDLLKSSGVILYGRITYELMEYWRPFIEKPSGEQAMDDFAKAIDAVPKIVFSHTLKNAGWHSAELADKPLDELVTELKKQPGNDVLAGSRSLIIELLNLGLLDELQLCIHPVIAGKGAPLFDRIDRTVFELVKTKAFRSGAIIHYYKPA